MEHDKKNHKDGREYGDSSDQCTVTDIKTIPTK
jgi:hypothetical protein